MRHYCLVGVLAMTASAAHAATVTFSNDPFANSSALTTPGRQVEAINEVFLPTFSTSSDVFAFDLSVPAFGAVGNLSFFNGLAAGLPTGGLTTIVLQDTDNDANPATAFNAGAAANLIAARLSDTPTPGFFLYWNSALNVNRLVYSTDLSVNTADLSVLARITSPVGIDAINTLPTFSSGNFAFVPEPSTLALTGLLLGAAFGRRVR